MSCSYYQLLLCITEPLPKSTQTEEESVRSAIKFISQQDIPDGIIA